jgi:hypothetical protein
MQISHNRITLCKFFFKGENNNTGCINKKMKRRFIWIGCADSPIGELAPMEVSKDRPGECAIEYRCNERRVKRYKKED